MSWLKTLKEFMAKKDNGPSFEKNRERLVKSLRHRGYIKTDKVADAIGKVPRELFVPSEAGRYAYDDRPIRIDKDQTISAPHIVAMMTELLDLEEGQSVLEIGAGSGYHAAVTAEIVGARNVHSVERYEDLAENSRRNLEKAGYSDVLVVIGDGSKGLPEYAPYDRIYLTCSAPKVPEPLKQQLSQGGRILLPVGRTSQTLVLYIEKDGEFIREDHGGVRFVPLVGEYGFPS